MTDKSSGLEEGQLEYNSNEEYARFLLERLALEIRTGWEFQVIDGKAVLFNQFRDPIAVLDLSIYDTLRIGGSLNVKSDSPRVLGDTRRVVEAWDRGIELKEAGGSEEDLKQAAEDLRLAINNLRV